jgi:hypothetical protein
MTNQNLSLARALTFSGRFSPVARSSSLRISGLLEISSVVSAIIMKSHLVKKWAQG